MQDLMPHLKDETESKAVIPVADTVAVDTFGGRLHVEWNPQAAVTPLDWYNRSRPHSSLDRKTPYQAKLIPACCHRSKWQR